MQQVSDKNDIKSLFYILRNWIRQWKKTKNVVLNSICFYTIHDRDHLENWV